jgi:glyoxylase-like metal-dependent hydrolase (beta-lactamase superfamily II)
MRIHHLNCGCMCPLGGRYMDGFSSGPASRLICHCLLIETDSGLVLVDTGFGERDVAQPIPRLSAFFVAMNRIRFERRYTALAQVQALGFRREDVKHIVLTHLDFDHAGGIEDFPDARIHVLEAETIAASERRGFVARRRWRPRQWDEARHWRTYRPRGEQWFGFDAVRDLDGLPPDIVMIALPGHSPGHAGVAIRERGGWLLHAGDAYFYRREMDQDDPSCTPGLTAYQNLVQADREQRLRTRDRLQALNADPTADVTIFCSHDAVEFAALAQRSYDRALVG